MKTFCFTLCFVLMATVSTVSALEYQTRSYPFDNKNELQLTSPKLWKEKSNAFSINFAPKSGTSFNIIISVMYPKNNAPVKLTPADVLKAVQDTAEGAKSRALEKEISIKELGGQQFKGNYFKATDKTYSDKKSKPGEYKYLTQGAVAYKHTLLVFTILTNEKGERTIEEALKMLKNAQFIEK